MADIMRPPNLLPRVRCSSCHIMIAISAMGDHVCVQNPAAPFEPESVPCPTWPVISPSTFGSLPSSSAWPRLPKPPSAHNDPLPGPPSRAATADPFVRPSDPPSFRHGPSLSSSTVGPTDGHPPDRRSNLPGRPAPSFKNRNDRNAQHDPFSEPRPHRTPMPRTGSAPPEERSQPRYGPLSPRTHGGESVVRKMSAIAPGPFGVPSQPPRSGQSHPRDRPPYPPTRSPSAPTGSIPLASSGRRRAMDDRNGIDQTIRSAFQESRAPMALQPPYGAGPSSSPLLNRNPILSVDPLRHETTMSPAGARTPASPSCGPPPAQHRSDEHLPSRSGSAPEVSAPSSMSSRRPAEPWTGRPSATVVSPRPGNGPPLEPELPHVGERPIDRRQPISGGHMARSVESGSSRTDGSSQSSRAATESWSSYGSGSASDVRTTSSRSESPETLSTKSLGASPLGSFRANLQAGLDETGPSLPSSRYQPPSFVPRDDSERSDHPLPAPSSSPHPLPESPIDPTLQEGRLVRGHRTDTSVSRPRIDPAALVPPRPSRKTSRGPCRGCGVDIVGKSVSSADGRLTGRYHKQCFVCKTCQQPFDTTTFYVLDDHPYCERHYHQLNGSLCQACDGGIEGQFLQTDRMRKYHPNCLTCQECQGVLHHDYFEMNGLVYCELDAFRLARQPTPGDDSRRKNPERRTTRMLSMK